MRSLPYTFRAAVVIGTIFLVGFAAVVVPLFVGGGKARAEIAGSLPGTVRVGEATVITVALDNTSGVVITPICVFATFSPQVHLTSARFQGLDTVAFRDGRACGGSLSGQETINVKVTFTPATAGRAHVRLVAGEGTQEIGPPLEGDVVVTR